MKTMMKKALAVAVIAGVSGGVMAANDGKLGGDKDGNILAGGASKGDFDITMKVGSLARVFGLKDVTFDAPSQPTPRTLCIYANSTNFGVEATTTNDFALKNSGTVGATYELSLHDNTSGSGDNSVSWSSNTTGSQQMVAKALAPTDNELDGTCTTGNFSLVVNATLERNVTAADYTDTVTLTVTPI